MSVASSIGNGSVKSVQEMYMSDAEIHRQITETVSNVSSDGEVKNILKKFSTTDYFDLKILEKYYGTNDEKNLLYAIFTETRYYLRRFPVMVQIIHNHFDLHKYKSRLEEELIKLDADETALGITILADTMPMSADEQLFLVADRVREQLEEYKESTDFQFILEEIVQSHTQKMAQRSAGEKQGQETKSADVTKDDAFSDSDGTLDIEIVTEDLLEKKKKVLTAEARDHFAIEAGRIQQRRREEQREKVNAQKDLIKLKKNRDLAKAALKIADAMQSSFENVVKNIDVILATKFKQVQLKAILNTQIDVKDASGHEHTYRNSLTEPNLYGIYAILYQRYSTSDFSQVLPDVIELFNHRFDKEKLAKDPRILMQWVSEFRTFWEQTNFIENLSEEILAGILIVHSIPDNMDLKKQVLTKILEAMQENKGIVGVIQSFIEIEYNAIKNSTSKRTPQPTQPRNPRAEGTELAHTAETDAIKTIGKNEKFSGPVERKQGLMVDSPHKDRVWPYIAVATAADVCPRCSADPKQKCDNSCYTKQCTNCKWYGHFFKCCHNELRK